MIPSTTSRDADTPWDSPDADLVLRSADGDDFIVDKLFLVRTFQGFDDMFKSGLATGAGEGQETKEGRPVIELSESSAVLQTLLRLTYPADPGLKNLNIDAMLDLCVALDKYCVTSYPRAVIDRLTGLAQRWPEVSYMRACRFRLPEVAAAAMKASLRSPKLFTNVLPADYTISMEQHHAFATYQLQCRKKAISVVHDLAWMYAQQPHPPGFYVGQEARARGERTCETCYKSPQHTFYAKSTQSTTRLAVGQQFTCNAKLSSWLSYYLDMVELALVQDTAGAVATNHARIDAVFSLRQAIICDGCKTTENALGMVKFAEKLKAEIDRQIATVDVSVPGIV